MSANTAHCLKYGKNAPLYNELMLTLPDLFIHTVLFVILSIVDLNHNLINGKIIATLL
jgi:hypothetical protein